MRVLKFIQRVPSLAQRASKKWRSEDQELQSYTTLWYSQLIDHFNFQNSQTYQQRYLVNDKYWDKHPGSPMLFYTGNEGDIAWFYNNTG